MDAKTLWPSSFIETENEMETFLEKLRTELGGLDADERIQIK
ncbi:MAG: hypothetical protein R3F21_18570 [Myxococcota bacterium]